MGDNRVESQLWDFKETLEMWQIRATKDKQEAEVKFCEQIVALANAKGGVLIIGVTDKPPRRIVGVQDLENRLKSTKSVLKRYVNYVGDYVHFQEIPMKNEEGQDKSCLIIAVAQTRNVVAVRDHCGRFTYPIRLETGLERADYDKIKNLKRNVLHDNYDYILDLKQFLND
ncbi:MAG: ATP-binding protein [archaeon]|nr:ATP-binding protein [archaeon]